MTIEEAIKELEQRLTTLKFIGGSYVDCVNDEAIEMAIAALKFWQDVKKGQFIIYRAARGSGKTDLKGIGYTKEQIEQAFNDIVNFNSFLMNIINEKHNDCLGGEKNERC